MNELVQGAEERLLNVWPAITTMMIEGWALRFANGYSARANSASAIMTGAVMTPQLLDDIECQFAEQGLTPTVRVTPVADGGTAEFLSKRGYQVKDEAITMARPLPFEAGEADARVSLSPVAEQEWLTGISARQQASKRNPAHLAAIVNRIALPVAFATLHEAGQALGFGLAAVDRGWVELGSIMIDEGCRGRGLGHGLVSTLLGWGQSRGATLAFLQVDAANMPAVRLYERLGFAPFYRYTTMIKAT